MVQSLLLFTLGFLVASLLALLFAPLLWRRAQTIMRRKVEAIVPMSLDEVRADRDALRAEHAMAMRRLEVENEEVRRIDAEHVIEIGRGKEALKQQADAIARRDARIAALERREEQLTEQLRKRERELSALQVTAQTAAREVKRQRERADTTLSSLRAVEAEGERQANTIAALERDLAAASSDLTEARASVAQVTSAIPDREGDAALQQAEAKIAELERTLAETDEELRTRIVALGDRLVRIVGYLQADESDPRPIGKRVKALLAKVEDEDPDRPVSTTADDYFDEFDRVAAREIDSVSEEVEPARQAS